MTQQAFTCSKSAIETGVKYVHLTHSSREYFKKLARKNKQKKATLNGCILKARTNSDSKLTFSESSFSFLQSRVVVLHALPIWVHGRGLRPYNPVQLPAARWAQRVIKLTLKTWILPNSCEDVLVSTSGEVLKCYIRLEEMLFQIPVVTGQNLWTKSYSLGCRWLLGQKSKHKMQWVMLTA